MLQNIAEYTFYHFVPRTIEKIDKTLNTKQKKIVSNEFSIKAQAKCFQYMFKSIDVTHIKFVFFFKVLNKHLNNLCRYCKSIKGILEVNCNGSVYRK